MPDNKLAETQQKFKDFYDKNLYHIYTVLEPIRKQHLRQSLQRTGLTVALCAFWVMLGYFDIISFESPFFTYPCMFILIFGLIAVYMTVSDYYSEAKTRVMKKILSFWGDFQYGFQKRLINHFVIKKSDLFTYFNSEDIDDAFSGTYKDTSISVSEHSLKIHTSKGDITTFRGILILLKFNKRFKGQTIALNKGRWINFLLGSPLLCIVLAPFLLAPIGIYLSTHHISDLIIPFSIEFILLAAVALFFAVIYRIYRYFHPKRATQFVALEGIPFLRKWRVYTDNQIEARYILTPALMEKILEVKKLFHGRHIDFSFSGGHILIAVHTGKDMFETTSLFSSTLKYKKVREVVSQLHSIFSIIDILDIKDTEPAIKKSRKTSGQKKRGLKNGTTEL